LAERGVMAQKTKVKRVGRWATPVGEMPIPNVDELPMP